MSVDPSVLQAIWNKLDAAEEPLSEQDRENLALAKRSGQISIENSKRSAAIGGDADGAIIITGDNNTIKLPKNDYEAISEINDPQRIELIIEVKTQVENLLNDYHSCDSRVIDIDLEIQQNQVKPQWAENTPSPTIKNKLLKTEKEIIKFFDDKNGRFLILGEAGSGKTVALLLLAKRLLKIAENSRKYLPLIIDIDAKSRENKNESFFEWLTSQLKERYSFENKKAVKKFVEDNHSNIILLIDSLDRLELEEQKQIIKDINLFLPRLKMKIIICCRTTNYQRCGASLKLNSAVCLQPLQEMEIWKYLQFVVSPAVWEEVGETIRNDRNILEIIKTPLFLFQLKTILVSESHRDFIEILRTKSYQDLQGLYYHLFDKYIEDSLIINPYRKIPVSISRQWIIILAKTINEEKTTEFFIEKMQPSWFQGVKKIRQRKEYQLLNGLISGFISLPPAIGIGILLNDGRFSIMTFLSSLIILSATAIVAYNQLEINLIETLGLSLAKVRNSLSHIYMHWKEHALGAITGNIIATSTDEIKQLLASFGNSGTIVLIRSLIGTLFSSLITWLNAIFHDSKLEIEERSFANKGVRKTVINAIVLTFIFMILGFFTASFIRYLTNQNSQSTIVSLRNNNYHYVLETGYIGGLSGVIIGVLSVGLPCIQHFTLRLVLYKYKYIPWNYARFLNHASIQYKLLQRTGGSYRFVHPLLQEYFANMDTGENYGKI